MGEIKQLGIVSGYLVKPASQGSWPAVIVIQEWWGLDAQTRSIADRLAGVGYLAFAPDLYHGELAALGDGLKAGELSKKYGPAAPEELQQAFDALKNDPDCSGKVGCIGFCFGGRMSLALGIRRPLDALCTFYGGGMQVLFNQLGNLKSPVLAFFGDKDVSIPAGTIEEFQELLGKLGLPHKVIVYPDSGHAFFRDMDPVTYRPEAARDAWTRVTKFFSENLN
jgi:carboxymethylenebutenolidase